MSPLQNVYGDLALDASVVAGNAILTIIAAAVADLDANTDTIEALLTTIDAAIAAGNVDLAAIAASVADLDGNTDTIEALLLAGNLDLAAIAAAVADIDLNTDTIETLLGNIDASVGAGNASLVAIDNNTNNLETLAATGNATLLTIDGRVDGLETLAAATNALLTTIDGRVDGLEALSTAANALLTTIDSALNQTATTPAGLSAYRNFSLLNVGQSIKGSAAKLYTIVMINNQAADRFVKLYNVAGVPTAADVPVFTFALSATDGVQVVTFQDGVSFPLGLGIRATTGVADADNGAPGANQVNVNIGFR